MKKVVFFDGDGTLWYPHSTERRRLPHWVYEDPTITDPIAEFVVTPTTVKTLTRLGDLGIKRVLLSTSPLAPQEAILNRIEAARHVEIHHLLDDIQTSPTRVTGKGERIVELLHTYGISSEAALMVGDSFEWDFKSAQDVGVDGALLQSDYQAEFAAQVGDRIIVNTIDVLGLI